MWIMSYEYNVLTHVEQCIMVTSICFTGESAVSLHKCTHRASEQGYALHKHAQAYCW